MNLPQKRESISSRKQRRFSNVINFNENTMLYNSGKQYKVVPMLDLSGTNVNQKISRSRKQSVNSRRYSIASSIMNFSDANRINISDDEITNLIKMQLNDGSSWNIKSISVNGSDAMDYVYSYKKTKLYVMKPDEKTVLNAKNNIKRILDEN